MPAHRKSKQEAFAIQLLLDGYTAADAARHRRVRVHPTTVQRWAEKNGIELTYPYNRHESRSDLVDNDYIIQLSQEMFEGKPLFTRAEIAELAECSVSWVKQVRARAREDGLLD